MDQPGQDGLTDAGYDAFAELEHQGGDDVVLLRLGLADEEQPRLAVVVGEAFRPDAQLARLPPAAAKSCSRALGSSHARSSGPRLFGS